MKLLLLPLLILGAGAGWYGLDSASGAPDECSSDACRVTVECTGPDTCLVTCYDENDAIVCQEEVACDEVCDKPCDAPCEEGAKPAAGKACAPGPDCSR